MCYTEPGQMIPYTTATKMAGVYKSVTSRLRELAKELDQQTDLLTEAFHGTSDGRTVGRGFKIGLRYDYNYDGIETILGQFKRSAWDILSSRIGIRKIMSVKARQQFEDQLANGDLPEISEETIIGILQGFCNQATELAQEAIKEVFEWLKPSARSHAGSYKTNSSFRVGKRVVIPYGCETGWNTCRVNYNKEKYLIALDSAFHTLGGFGPLTGTRGALVDAINRTSLTERRGETDLFEFKCFKNGNLHIRFKRLDLVKELNRVATGIAELGDE